MLLFNPKQVKGDHLDRRSREVVSKTIVTSHLGKLCSVPGGNLRNEPVKKVVSCGDEKKF